ncbi:integrase, catalytic region, zinc finger, CCHC-type containing protein [Tanacetum coccineum]
MGSSSRNTSSYYVTHPSSVVDYDEEYEQDDVHNHSEDPLASAMLLLAKAITQNFSNPTNNHLRASSNTRNQAVVQGDKVNIQRRNSGNTSTGQCYNCGGKGHYARNCPKPRVRDSKYFMEQMLLAKQDEAGVILTDEQNDFLFADASRMEEIEELSANICLMARIQPADQNSDDEPSYESAFVSEVQSSSINENDEQMYPTHTKIINSTIDDDQINRNIQFDFVRGNVNSGSVEKDTHVYDQSALETLARNAYDEAAKQQRFAQKNSKRASMFYTSKEEIALNDFCRDQVKPLLNELLDYFDGFQNLFQRDIKEMKDAFEQNDVYLDEIERQNDLLKDQLLEASLKHDIELCVLLNHECVDKSLHDELEQVKKKSLEIQEGLKARIKILEKAVQRCEKQKRDNAKMEYKMLFDSIKKTQSQTQKEMDELITHVSEKTYAYGAIRAENQNLLVTISELKARMKMVKMTSHTKQTGTHQNTNVISPGMYRVVTQQESQTNKSKNEAKKEVVYVRKNKQIDNTFANVVSNKENVIDVAVVNASKAKTLLCVSCMQSVLIPCHDKCVAKHKLNVRSNARRTFFVNSRIPKSSETTFVAPKTRFFEKATQSKTLDTTFVASKSKIDEVRASNARDKVVQIVLWIVDSGCSKHMTGERSLLRNFVEKFMGTVRFGNDNFAAITGYGDYIHGNITICHVYYDEGLGHNLFSVGQFCDRDLEVAFRSKTCYVRNLEGDDLLTGERDSNLYTISISDMAASSPICLMSKATFVGNSLLRDDITELP